MTPSQSVRNGGSNEVVVRGAARECHHRGPGRRRTVCKPAVTTSHSGLPHWPHAEWVKEKERRRKKKRKKGGIWYDSDVARAGWHETCDLCGRPYLPSRMRHHLHHRPLDRLIHWSYSEPPVLIVPGCPQSNLRRTSRGVHRNRMLRSYGTCNTVLYTVPSGGLKPSFMAIIYTVFDG
jgi:hypothetical protein